MVQYSDLLLMPGMDKDDIYLNHLTETKTKMSPYICSLLRNGEIINCQQCKCKMNYGFYFRNLNNNSHLCIGCLIEPDVLNMGIKIMRDYNKNGGFRCKLCNRDITNYERYVFYFEDDMLPVCSSCGLMPYYNNKMLNYSDTNVHYLMVVKFLEHNLITQFNIMTILKNYVDKYGSSRKCLEPDIFMEIMKYLFISANIKNMVDAPIEYLYGDQTKVLYNALVNHTTPILGFIHDYINEIEANHKKIHITEEEEVLGLITNDYILKSGEL